MKKTIIILSAAALVFASCQKEQPSSAIANGLQLTATVEQQDGGSTNKTYLDVLAVKWSAGDQVNVFTDDSETLTLTLAEGGAGSTVGTFTTSETPTGTAQYAIYPASDDNSISGSTITFTLPATQDYVANSFDNGANVAVGQVIDGSVNYKNVCGVFRLSIKGGYTVSRIELTGNASEKLNGTFSVDATAATPYISTVTTSVDSEKKLTLNCGTNGVQLDVATATDFYFVVPTGAFASGFDAVVYDMADDAYSVTFSSTSANTINRSKVRAMPTAAATRLPDGYTELAYIKSNYKGNTSMSSIDDNPYIITNFIPEDNVGFEIKFLSESDFVMNSTFGCLFGSRTSSGDQDFQLTTYSGFSYFGTLRTGEGNSSTYDYEAGLKKNTVISCSLHNGVYQNPNGVTTSVSYYLSNSTWPVYVFALNNSNSPIQGSRGASIYMLKLYNGNDSLSFYGIPAKNSNDVVGLYDMITGDFLVNANTTSATAAFIAGTALE